MKRSVKMRMVSALLAISSVFSLTACGAAPTESVPSTNAETMSIQETTVPATTAPAATAPVVEETTAETTVPETQVTTVPTEPPTEPTLPPETIPPEEVTDEFGMTKQQRNSFSMLYYLAITAEKIRIAKDNRLILDDIYSNLLNDINPGAIDEITQEHLENLRDIIKSYMNISVKRERLQYIYNQNKAAAIEHAVPDPLAILSVVHSFNWKKLALSVAYTAYDSYNGYKNADKSAEQEFLTSGWELDDEELATIQGNRESAFDYMVDVVQEYHLDGKLTLNERDVGNFAKICAIGQVPQRLQRLEAETDTYKLLGNYWLALADCYYETEQYEKCLECMETYGKLSTGIYRKDYNVVQLLPKAIVAAQHIYSGEAYITNISALADAIIENTNTEEWSVRYFAAQVYLDLYNRTHDAVYLQEAYEIAYDNVGVLLHEQKSMNQTYLADLQEAEAVEPDYWFMSDEDQKEAKAEYKAEKKRVKAYNEAMQEYRETELPPIYEPLRLNCDLLFALAEKRHISPAEKRRIEAVLETETNGVFLSEPVNNRYSFEKHPSDAHMELNTDEMKIPVSLLTDGTIIQAELTGEGGTVLCDDCVITKVERENEAFSSFYAVVSSDKFSDYAWAADSKITVKIISEEQSEPQIFRFKVSEYDQKWYWWDKVVFEQA